MADYDGEALSEEQQAIVAAELQDAADYIDTDIAKVRTVATKYYRGEPFGDEEAGRSQVVTHDVRDTVLAILPSIMRIFFGSERLGEYEPRGPEDTAAAEQASDYANAILREGNDVYLQIYAAVKDALTRKLGVLKVWWDDSTTVATEHYSGLDEGALQLLQQEPDCDIVAAEGEPDPTAPPPPVDPMTGVPLAAQPMRYEVELRRRTKRGRIRIAALPGEEFLIDRAATSIENARITAHRTYKTISELVAMGYDREMVEEYAAAEVKFGTNEEYNVRLPSVREGVTGNNPLLKEVLYYEAYMPLDMDADGIAELCKVCAIGSAFKVVNAEPVSVAPFADFHADPEPHQFFGNCPADECIDIQSVKSHVLRATLDSLALSIYPRTAVVEGQASLEDVLNTEIGAPIRMRAPGMVQPFMQPFVGKEAFPVLGYLDEVKEARTGQSKASMGLDADALQSTTRAAVAATISASQGRTELLARNLAETGLRRLFQLILRLVTTHQDRPMMVRLRNQWVPIDPRAWDAAMDVRINIALGSGGTEEKMAALAQIAQKQEQLLQLLGPSNPLVGLGQYATTLSKMIELAGWRDSGQFINRLPADFQMPPPQQPQQSPEQMLAAVQAQAIQADIQKKAAELQLRREEMMRSDDRERDKMDADVVLKAAELRAKYGAQVDIAYIKALTQAPREGVQQQPQQRQPNVVPFQ